MTMFLRTAASRNFLANCVGGTQTATTARRTLLLPTTFTNAFTPLRCAWFTGAATVETDHFKHGWSAEEVEKQKNQSSDATDKYCTQTFNKISPVVRDRDLVRVVPSCPVHLVVLLLHRWKAKQRCRIE